jgi:hypothetical protein
MFERVVWFVEFCSSGISRLFDGGNGACAQPEGGLFMLDKAVEKEILEQANFPGDNGVTDNGRDNVEECLWGNKGDNDATPRAFTRLHRDSSRAR